MTRNESALATLCTLIAIVIGFTLGWSLPVKPYPKEPLDIGYEAEIYDKFTGHLVDIVNVEKGEEANYLAILSKRLKINPKRLRMQASATEGE